MPCVTSTSSPSRRPVVTGTATALPTPCALASRTSTTLSPEAEVWIAVSGSTTALSVAGNTSAAVAYMPDCSTWSGLGSRACTVALRVWLSTRGSMELTLASNTRPGTASTLTCTVAPGASLGRSCCGSVKFTYNGSSCVNVATGSPAFRYWPTLTRRMPIWPANGAWTRFCSMRASSCRTAATAWAASALRCSSTCATRRRWAPIPRAPQLQQREIGFGRGGRAVGLLGRVEQLDQRGPFLDGLPGREVNGGHASRRIRRQHDFAHGLQTADRPQRTGDAARLGLDNRDQERRPFPGLATPARAARQPYKPPDTSARPTRLMTKGRMRITPVRRLPALGRRMPGRPRRYSYHA